MGINCENATSKTKIFLDGSIAECRFSGNTDSGYRKMKTD